MTYDIAPLRDWQEFVQNNPTINKALVTTASPGVIEDCYIRCCLTAARESLKIFLEALTQAEDRLTSPRVDVEEVNESIKAHRSNYTQAAWEISQLEDGKIPEEYAVAIRHAELNNGTFVYFIGTVEQEYDFDVGMNKPYWRDLDSGVFSNTRDE